jgi:outer membrane protein TolC
MRGKLFLVCLPILMLCGQEVQFLEADEALQTIRRQNFAAATLTTSIATLQNEQKSLLTTFWPDLQLRSSYQFQSEEAVLQFAPGLPQINLNYHHSARNVLQMQWALFDGFNRMHQARAMNHLQQNLQAQRADLELKLLKNALLLSNQYNIMQIQMQLLQTSRQRVIQSKQKLLHLARSGYAALADTLLFTIQIQNIEKQRIALELQRQNLPLQIAEVMGGNAPVVVAVSQLTPKQNPTIYSIEADEALIAATMEKSQAENGAYWPKIGAYAGLHYNKPAVNPTRYEWQDYFSIGLELQWEIWDWGRRSLQKQNTKLEQNLHRQAAAQTIAARERQAQQLQYEISANERHIELARAQMQTQQKYYEVQLQRFNQFQLDATTLTDAELALREAELNLETLKLESVALNIEKQFFEGRFDYRDKIAEEK